MSEYASFVAASALRQSVAGEALPIAPGLLGHLSQEINALLSERNELIAARNEAQAKHEQLQRSAGDLRQMEAKLGAARAEYNRVLEMTEAKAQAASAKEEMVSLLKRIGQVKEREQHDQTGSIRQPEPPKRPAR